MTFHIPERGSDEREKITAALIMALFVASVFFLPLIVLSPLDTLNRNADQIISSK